MSSWSGAGKPPRWTPGTIAALGRLALVVLAFLVQLALLVAMVVWLAQWAWALWAGSFVLGLAVLVILVNKPMPEAYRFLWSIVVLLLPIAGSALYLLIGRRLLTPKAARGLQEARERAAAALPLVGAPAPPSGDPAVERQRDYLEAKGRPDEQLWRAFADTATTYFPLGEDAFENMLAAVAGAKRYVFVEYFIVDRGVMWDAFAAALAERADDGVDVRLLYDDVGSLFTLPDDLHAWAKQHGIKVASVNRMRGALNLRLNNRDHRKILVIDGSTAYTGGINIADEYINAYPKHGHWKDTAVRLDGPGAWALTVMFVGLWEAMTDIREHYPALLPRHEAEPPHRPRVGSVVLPFDDSPFEPEPVALNAYKDLIARATATVDIFTPYLIVGEDLTETLCAAARSGVRVRVVTPGHGDKKSVHAVTRGSYPRLVGAGVEVYEYTPGFIHAKSVLVDGEVGVIGSINMDYRSFYLHAECAVWMYRSEALAALALDVERTLTRCTRITPEAIAATPARTRLARALLRIVAPIM